MGSIASASIVANRAFSESSKKDLTASPVISNVDCTDCGLDEVLKKHHCSGGAGGERGGGTDTGARGNRKSGARGNNAAGKTSSGDGEASGNAVGLCELSDDMDESSFSSFYSSFLKTDNSSEGHSGAEKKESNEMCWESGSIGGANGGKIRGSPRGGSAESGGGGGSTNNGGGRAKRRPNPPWLDNVSQTKDLIYRYQINERSIKELLDSDNVKLKKFSQPILVNDQLGQLYLDLELEGLSAKLKLSDATSGSSSDDCDTKDKTKVTKRNMKYSKLVMIYEENAPFPPPNDPEPEP